jgi:DNA adenine methylase
VSGPFLKWAGGKTQLLPVLERYFPPAIDRYTEPFVGSGAVFFHLRAGGRLVGEVTLADSNRELIHAYAVVRDQLEELLAALDAHRAAHRRDHYYRVRAGPFTPDVAGAARTIYLNKTCFNGLYRVNRSGRFNVPMGDYRDPAILDEPALRRASQALQGVRLLSQPFQETIAAAAAGWLYLDPPYVPLSPTASFTGYVPGGFGPADQEALAASVRAAAARGLQFVLSNSHTPAVCRLYQDFVVASVPARRAINSNAARRGPVDEAIVTNFIPDP